MRWSFIYFYFISPFLHVWLDMVNTPFHLFVLFSIPFYSPSHFAQFHISVFCNDVLVKCVQVHWDTYACYTCIISVLVCRLLENKKVSFEWFIGTSTKQSWLIKFQGKSCAAMWYTFNTKAGLKMGRERQWESEHLSTKNNIRFCVFADSH